MTDDIPYPLLIDQAMRSVVREVLKRVNIAGLPGDHHFYISYNTRYPGVKMSDQLRAKYPQEITIVLQHQFWDFKIEEQMFHVTLSFSGVPEKLTVPYAALTAFADPSVKFGLQFQNLNEGGDAAQLVAPAEKPVSEGDASAAAAASAEILSLDSFRKK